MKGLINGQTIRFDAHDSGSGRPVTWENGLHLHKIMNNNKYKGVEVLIPIDNDKDIQFRKSYDSDIERSIKREISDVLNKDPKKRKELIQELIKTIDRYSKDLSPEARLSNIKQGANRIAKHFQLNDFFNFEIDNNVTQCLTTHYDENNKICFILQDLRNKTIKLGDELPLLQDNSLFIE